MWHDFTRISARAHPWQEDKPQPSLRELLTEKLGARYLKGFAKQMPKVPKDEAEAEAKAESEARQRQKMNYKTHINRMSLAEINEYLSDPILRKQLTPQLMQSDYELITNELGQIVAVEPPPKLKE